MKNRSYYFVQTAGLTFVRVSRKEFDNAFNQSIYMPIIKTRPNPEFHSVYYFMSFQYR